MAHQNYKGWEITEADGGYAIRLVNAKHTPIPIPGKTFRELVGYFDAVPVREFDLNVNDPCDEVLAIRECFWAATSLDQRWDKSISVIASFANCTGLSYELSKKIILLLGYSARLKKLHNMARGIETPFPPAAKEYRGWRISFDRPPIPLREFDWSATSPDYDVDCDEDGPYRCAGKQVHAATYDELLVEIDAAIEEDE